MKNILLIRTIENKPRFLTTLMLTSVSDVPRWRQLVVRVWIVRIATVLGQQWNARRSVAIVMRWIVGIGRGIESIIVWLQIHENIITWLLLPSTWISLWFHKLKNQATQQCMEPASRTHTKSHLVGKCILNEGHYSPQSVCEIQYNCIYYNILFPTYFCSIQSTNAKYADHFCSLLCVY